MSDETKKKLSDTMKRIGIKPPNNLGYKKSQETKDKISKAHKGKIISEEHKIRLKEFNTGKVLSEETPL